MIEASLDKVFITTLSLFLFGTFAAAVSQKPRTANLIAHTASFLGGMTGAITALGVLLGQQTIFLSAWYIIADISLSFRIDALSAFFLLIICMLAVAVSIYSIGYVTEYYHKKNIGLLGGGLNLFLLSMVLVVTVDNGFAFLIAWELMSLVSFFLVMYEHERPGVRRAGYVYVVMTHIGTVFITLSFLALFLFTGSFSFTDFQAMSAQFPNWLKNLIFIMALIGFGTKAGIVPLHVWLPRAHPAAPSHISALMSAVMIKTAAYGLLRVSFDFLGGGPVWWGAIVLAAGALSAFIGILFGLAENDIKRFLAYSSAENMGIIFMGIGACLVFNASQQSLLAALALTAALYHILNHAMFKGTLFMGAGAVLFATHTRNINELGGLIKRMPYTAVLFLIGGLALSALPPFNGFISEWATFQSLLHLSFDIPNPWWKISGGLAAAALGITGAFAAGGIIKHFGTAFLAMPRSEHARGASEVPASMRAGMAILALFSLVLGVWPGFVLAITKNINEKMFHTHLSGDAIWYVPFAGQKTETLFPGIVLLTLLGILMLGALLLRFWAGKGKVHIDETWNCGTSLESSMQYTGTAYSHPVLRIMQRLTGTHKKVKVYQQYAYYPRKIGYHLYNDHSIEDAAYKPVVAFTVKVSQVIRMIQNGNLQSYLAYMVITLIMALLWIRQV
ncbi:MAG: hydrogenase 4 subunit B [Pelosinus sp.]|nr:hydrogenase 4 subunit B [Pelosinus sp.]